TLTFDNRNAAAVRCNGLLAPDASLLKVLPHESFQLRTMQLSRVGVVSGVICAIIVVFHDSKMDGLGESDPLSEVVEALHEFRGWPCSSAIFFDHDVLFQRSYLACDIFAQCYFAAHAGIQAWNPLPMHLRIGDSFDDGFGVEAGGQ